MSAYLVQARLLAQKVAILLVMALMVFAVPPQAQAQDTAFRQAVAQAANGDRDLLAFYSERNFVR